VARSRSPAADPARATRDLPPTHLRLTADIGASAVPGSDTLKRGARADQRCFAQISSDKLECDERIYGAFPGRNVMASGNAALGNRLIAKLIC
jgi:hypothetical protein